MPEPRQPEPTPLSPAQKIMISNLRRSQEGAVPVSLFATTRADRLLDLTMRGETTQSRLTVTALVAHLLVRTLMDHPAMRRALVDGEAIVEHDAVHLGVAVARTDGSLIVPVVHNASELAPPALGEAISELTRRARADELSLADVRGGNFTLSSTGRVSIAVHGTPLLNARQSGILLVGAAESRAVVDGDGEVRAARMLPLSLTIDHAVVNGVPALEFLADLAARIADPAALINDHEE